MNTNIYKVNQVKNPSFTGFNLREARVENFDKVQIVEGSDEVVFKDIYVTGVINGNRLGRFLKSAVTYL
jgi:hypothetical protein